MAVTYLLFASPTCVTCHECGMTFRWIPQVIHDNFPEPRPSGSSRGSVGDGTCRLFWQITGRNCKNSISLWHWRRLARAIWRTVIRRHVTVIVRRSVSRWSSRTTLGHSLNAVARRCLVVSWKGRYRTDGSVWAQPCTHTSDLCQLQRGR